MFKTLAAIASTAMLAWSVIGMFEKVNAAVRAPACYQQITSGAGAPEDDAVKACTDRVVTSLNDASRAMADVHRGLMMQALKAVPSN